MGGSQLAGSGWTVSSKRLRIVAAKSCERTSQVEVSSSLRVSRQIPVGSAKRRLFSPWKLARQRSSQAKIWPILQRFAGKQNEPPETNELARARCANPSGPADYCALESERLDCERAKNCGCRWILSFAINHRLRSAGICDLREGERNESSNEQAS